MTEKKWSPWPLIRLVLLAQSPFIVVSFLLNDGKPHEPLPSPFQLTEPSETRFITDPGTGCLFLQDGNYLQTVSSSCMPIHLNLGP